MNDVLPTTGFRRGDMGFALAGALVIAAALLIGAHLSRLEDPAALALGVAADLTIGLPAAFYLLVARPRGWSPTTVIPIVILGFVVAKIALPTEYQAPLRAVEFALVPLELAIVTLVVVRLRRALRAAPPEGVDGLERLRHVARGMLPAPRLADALAGELAVFHFAFAAWRQKPHVAPGTRALSTHRRIQHGPLVFALVLLSIGEVLAAHFLLQLWSSIAAWTATGLGVYGILWLVADYRATVLRPVLIGDEVLHVRAGLRWDVRVPRALVAEVRTTEPLHVESRLSTAFLAKPRIWLVLSAPVTLSGPYGFRRRARAIGLTLDEALEEEADSSASRPL